MEHSILGRLHVNPVSIISKLTNNFFNLNQNAVEISISAAIFVSALIVALVIYTIFQRYLKNWAKRTETSLDDKILRNIKAPIFLLAILIGAFYALNFLPVVRPYFELLADGFTVATILLVTFIMIRLTNVLSGWYTEKEAEREGRIGSHIIFMFKKIIQAAIYLFALLVLLVSLGIDLSGVVVGLGVGGIAIALALQNVLSDVFSAFSIYFDRPFEIGDFIVVGDYMGTVKKIGIKSTRLQLLQGEELVISNKELTTTSVRNFRKLKKRRVVFTVGVSCDTPVEKLKEIPGIIREIIEKMELVELDRVHFSEFGNYSYNFLVVYYMDTDDYVKYMDTQQEINFAILEAFEKKGIEMPFPTQTIFLNKKEEG
jgi:small-conductance mechanosensitive channel